MLFSELTVGEANSLNPEGKRSQREKEALSEMRTADGCHGAARRLLGSLGVPILSEISEQSL